MSAISEMAVPTRRLSLPTLILTSTFALGANLVWLAYNIFLLPVQVQAVTSEATKGIAVGVLAGVAIGIAVLVNIVAGIVSDHSRSRFGRRRPMMIWGMILTLPFILLPVFVPLSLPTVVIAYVGMQIFTNVSSGAWQPTLADFVPVEQRGISAGIKGVFTLLGSAIGVGVITGMFAANLQSAAYILIAFLLASMTLINVFAMRRLDKPLLEATRLNMWQVLVEMFHIKRRPGIGVFWWFVLGSFMIYMGVSGFQFFGVYYIESVLHITKPEEVATAIQIAGLINLVIGVIFALLAGYLSDKFGRRNIIIISVVIATIVGLLFPFARTFVVFLAFSAFYGAANGVILSVDTALTSDLVPLEEAGKYMAYANLAVGVANGAAPPLFGLILNFQGAPTLNSFIAFFVVSAIFFVISIIVMALKVPNR
ncbi:MAG: MFS transporter [Ktedonobacteraceae bacterium]|nr:MFS transporter [Ktedonobacteraceae bacterium]